MSESESASSESTVPARADDSVSQLAADLRKLRLQAGSPTYVRLETETGVSRTVLSEAFAGKKLPSARTVGGIVKVCGGDVHSWIDRRDSVADELTAHADNATEMGVDDKAPDAPSRAGISRRVAVLLMMAAFACGVAATSLVVVIVPNLTQPDEEVPRIVATTGNDPATTPCIDDAVVASRDPRTDNALIEILWSDKCKAGWGRITRYDGLASGNSMTVAIYPEPAPLGPDRQEAIEHDVDGAYTDLVVRPSPHTLLCVEGSFTVDGRQTSLGEPLCI